MVDLKEDFEFDDGSCEPEKSFEEVNRENELVIMISWIDLKRIWDKNKEKKTFMNGLKAWFNYHFNYKYYSRFANFGIDILNHSRINVDNYKKL